MYSVTQKKVDRMIQVVRESVTGIRIIKALSKTDYESGRFDKISKDLSDQEQTASITMATTNPLMNLYLNSGLVIVILLGAYMVYSGTTQIGRIIAFQSYFTIILNARDLHLQNVRDLFQRLCVCRPDPGDSGIARRASDHSW